MDITKCDICKKIKKERLSFGDKSNWVGGTIRGKEWFSFDLCGKCGNKLLKYIKRYLRIHEQKRK